MKNYLCKFIPPRDEFLATMSDDEKTWMAGHGAFLDDLLDQGIASFTSRDPIVANGVGHYEHNPMPHLKARD
ncbi:hypothetical protein [Agrobacterium tumefaciens]|uniref:hypothetical protein n=1 Tax=Agrobacterium tumefaciens TaxID=358 RepID=UPI001572A8BE|nr:hypothetical protein [Agrobacterium tumefaciens]NTB05414.1 hypothetical protein [Agrobacterium tumefaciens]NTE53200.1 hypothetical protein [Agrobacterium tumefaciens]